MIEQPGDREKKITTIFIIALVIIATISTAYILIFELKIFDKQPENTEPEVTTEITYVTPSDAYNLIQTSNNLEILDVRSCKCSYNVERLTIKTNWTSYLSPEKYYNTTYDLLIYDDQGIDSSYSTATKFCEGLKNNTYNKIYMLEHGINDWKNAGYETYIPS
jgi:hypothetical protein